MRRYAKLVAYHSKMQPGPAAPAARLEQEIDLWILHCSCTFPSMPGVFRFLSENERGHAARFRFDKHRYAYVVGRGMLRLILAQYLNVAPESVEFRYTRKGKPESPGLPIHFNMSHSGDITLYVISRERLMGVDVEALRPMEDKYSIAKHFFCPAEYDELTNLPPNQQDEAFFNCWTRKEAYVKAIGDGLYAPLDRFQVTFAPGCPAAFVTIGGDSDCASEWSLFHLAPYSGYVGAIAIHGRGWNVRCRDCAEFNPHLAL